MSGPDANRPDPQVPADPADPASSSSRSTPGKGHDESGLSLARSVARSLAQGARRGASSSGRSSGSPSSRRTGLRVDPQASGAHPDERDPQTLDATIGRLVAEQGWGADVRVHGVFSRWDAIVGRDVAQHARPVSYQREDEGGRLLVRTDSTAWATQMRLLAATVVRRLNEELGDRTVTVIDVEGPSAPSWNRGRRSVRGGRGPRDTYG